MSSNKLASGLAAFTPQHPVSRAVAEGAKALAQDGFNKLAVLVDDYIRTASDGAAVEGGNEEILIILTAPPSPPPP